MSTSGQHQGDTFKPDLAPHIPDASNQVQAVPGRRRIGGIGLLLLGCVAYAGLATVHLSTGTLTHSSLPMTLRWVTLAFVVYLAMLWWAERRGQASLPIIWIGAIVFQGLLLLTAPTLSGDVYRYLWDGHIANHGVSPYAHPITAPELDALEVPIRALTNHSWMASPYLPAAQWLFRAVTGMMPLQARSMQLVMIFINLTVGLLIVALLGIAGLPRSRVAVYLWNPLVVVETANGAHLDVWMALLTLFAAWSALIQWPPAPTTGAIWEILLPWLSPVALGLATMTKIIPMLTLPVFYWIWQRRWMSVAIYTVTVAVALLPVGIGTGWGLTGPLDGRGLFGALRIYGDQWNYNSGIFHWLEIWLGDTGWGLSLELANQWAKRAVALLLLVILLLVWHYARRIRTPRAALRAMSVPFMAYALLTTTFHPWYLLALLAFLPFLAPGPGETKWQWLFVLPWLYLSAALFLSYLTYLDPLNLRELEWVRRMEWAPVLALLLLAVTAWLIEHRGTYRQP